MLVLVDMENVAPRGGIQRNSALFVLMTAVVFVPASTSCLRAQQRSIGCPPQGVLRGANVLTRSVFFKTDDISQVARIAPVRADNDEYLGIFGHSACCVVTWSGQTNVNLIRFGKHLDVPFPVDIDGDGTSEILGYGESPFPKAVVQLDASGRTVWNRECGGTTGPGVVVGDLDRDGTQEVYFSGGSTVGRLSLDGQSVWNKRIQPPLSYIGIDIYEGGKADTTFLLLLTNESMGVFYDHKGTVLRSRPLPRAGRDFRLIRWPSGGEAPAIITWKAGAIVVMNVDGRILFEHQFPRDYPSCKRIEATAVRFRDDEQPFLAVLVGFGGYTYGGMLCVFAGNGNLVYEEHLRKPGGLFATRIPGDRRSGQVLLVGCTIDGSGTVLSYRRD